MTVAVPPINPADLDPRTRPYEPCGACRKLFHCRDHEVAIAGPAGTGKTRAALELILYWASHYSGARILLCRATRASMTESVLPIWEQHVLPDGHPVLVGPHRGNRQVYSFANGAQVILGSLDRSERLLSMELDAVVVFQAEEITESDFELLLSRLRHNAIGYRQAILDLNPTHPGHWIKLRCDEGKTTLLSSTHHDNPVLWDHKRNEWTPQGREYM
ncbi:MAG: phage terminase large subunit, partial [Planctomycetota bacterium]